MDRTLTIKDILEQEISAYANMRALKGRLWAFSNPNECAYCVVFIPVADHPDSDPNILVMAHIENDKVIIDFDGLDKSLEETLLEAGIPREQIILAYAGEAI